MACKLTKTAGVRNYNGAIGASVQIAVDSNLNKAFIVSAVYAGNALVSPWKLVIVAGASQLQVLVANPNVGDLTRIQEACGDGGSNTLDEFNFDPLGATQAFVISGI
jgi:hypothetical protein